MCLQEKNGFWQHIYTPQMGELLRCVRCRLDRRELELVVNNLPFRSSHFSLYSIRVHIFRSAILFYLNVLITHETLTSHMIKNHLSC